VQEQLDLSSNDIDIKAVEEIVRRPDVREVLCPTLKSGVDDAFEIAKVITPILVPLVLAGTIAIPLNPILFATIAIVIARMGVAGLCAEYLNADTKDKK